MAREKKEQRKHEHNSSSIGSSIISDNLIMSFAASLKQTATAANQNFSKKRTFVRSAGREYRQAPACGDAIRNSPEISALRQMPKISQRS